MGAIRTLGATLAVKGTPTPAVLAAAGYTGTVIAVSAYTIVNGIATLTLASLPSNGFNGPNQAIAGYPANPAGGQQVTLWGFTNGTVFNGKKVTIVRNDPTAKTIEFYFNSTNDSNTESGAFAAPSPFQHYRAVRLECGQGLSSDVIYVGDLNVSSSRYMALLSLAGQLAIEIASENIPPEGIMIDTSGSGSGDTVQVSLVY